MQLAYLHCPVGLEKSTKAAGLGHLDEFPPPTNPSQDTPSILFLSFWRFVWAWGGGVANLS